MRLYNQLSKRVEEFKPQDQENVKIYSCGPTVYSFAHIGNLCSYIYWDLLTRTLAANGYKVNRVINLTDVGHLSSDADDGEDKLEKGARREKKTVWEIAEKYIDAFVKDYAALRLAPPSKFARATDYIDEDIALVNLLTEKGYTYETSDGVYFDTSKFPHYADFARLDLEQLKAGARVAMSAEKRNASDFAVWKFIRPGEDHAMQWDYLGRKGYPGWHLECATIAHKELGFPLDIHTGGIDHIPVHHTNEIAEAEAAFSGTLSRFWTHCNFITIDGEKISKSLGNIYTLHDLEKKGFAPLDFKLWVLQGHYQGTRNFSFDDLKAAQARRLGWRNRIAREMQVAASDPANLAASGASSATSGASSISTPDVSSIPGASTNNTSSTSAENASDANFRAALLALISDNLNSPEAFALIDGAELLLEDWEFVDKLFGLGLIDSCKRPSEKVLSLIADREEARAKKDFALADRLRDELADLGFTILDTAAGPIWQYAR